MIASTSWVGVLISQRILTRLKFFEKILSFTIMLSTQIRFSGDNLFVILERENESLLTPIFNECVNSKESKMSFANKWQKGVDKLPKSYGLNSDDKLLISEFGRGLGTTDIEGQLEHCALFLTRFEEKISEIKEDSKQKVKLYKTLGVFFGIALVILII